MNQEFRILFGTFLIAALTACSAPAERIDDRALSFGFNREMIQGTHFRHVIYWNESATVAGRFLHVYLDSDGTPWLNRYTVAADPTPRYPVALSLMAEDSAASLYLGRPCYHGQAGIASCNYLLWTSRRYGPEVVESMAAALGKFLDRTGHEGIVFIGYSGGGALAMLLAEHFASTRGVLTIAGNLNTERWADYHNYSPLQGSLNPAARPPLNPKIVQMHFAGGQDENVPKSIVNSALVQQPNAIMIVMEKFDHACCWVEVWPSMLNRWDALLRR